MSLTCLKLECGARIPGAVGSGKYFGGDEQVCRKCGTRYVVEVTDDYADDCVASLVEIKTSPTKRKKHS
jgi:hypothetical protein